MTDVQYTHTHTHTYKQKAKGSHPHVGLAQACPNKQEVMSYGVRLWPYSISYHVQEFLVSVQFSIVGPAIN